MTENDWVCDLATRATDLFTMGCVGLIIGTAIFSYIADVKGRLLAFYMSTVAMVAFQVIQVWVSHSYPAFLAMKVTELRISARVLTLFSSPDFVIWLYATPFSNPYESYNRNI